MAATLPEADKRQPALLVTDPGHEQVDVVDQLGPAVRPQLAEFVRGPRGGAVAPVIRAVDDQTAAGEGGREGAVALHVFTHAVGELHGGARLAGRVPPVADDLHAVAGRIGKTCRRFHRILLSWLVICPCCAAISRSHPRAYGSLRRSSTSSNPSRRQVSKILRSLITSGSTFSPMQQVPS